MTFEFRNAIVALEEKGLWIMRIRDYCRFKIQYQLILIIANFIPALQVIKSQPSLWSENTIRLID